METLTASWVLPVTGPPIRDGRVAIDGGRVAWVGRAGDPGEPEGPLRDLGRGILLPGLVNAHCHLELSHLAGLRAGGAGFVPWVESVVASRGRFAEEDVRCATAEALRFLEDRGTVAVGDVSNALAHLDLLAASRLSAVVFLELLAFDPARAEAVLAWADERDGCGSSPAASGARGAARRPCPALGLAGALPPAGRAGRPGGDPPGGVEGRGGVPRRAARENGRPFSNGGASATWPSRRRA